MFEQISSKLQGILSKLKGQGRLTEAHVEEALKELRMALLEADVHFRAVRQLCAGVREKAIGQEVLSSLTPAQQVLKILRDELTLLLGGEESRLHLGARWPSVVLMAGLSGSGKTTTTVKLGRLLAGGGRHPAVVSVDARRPAALEQLSVLARQANIPCLTPEPMEPIARAKAAAAVARNAGFDVLLVDTAGRLHVDSELMEELRELASAAQPEEFLLVADAMTGQDAVRSAEAFARAVPVSGHVLTKLDGDARGGAALSIVVATGRPIKFVGVGEKLDALEPFRPERMASRILGMGDLLTLIERAEQTVERTKAEELARKIRREEFSLEDFREQLRQVRRLGSLGELLNLLPGAARLPANLDERELKRCEAILDSMTMEERVNPSLLNGSRRLRIARGSGSSVAEVNRLLRRFAEARKLARAMVRPGGRAARGLGRLR